MRTTPIPDRPVGKPTELAVFSKAFIFKY